MKKALMVLAIALIATPASAQAASGNNASASKPQVKRSNKPVVREEQQRSAYSANPEYDVYFRGEYVGSDPDPRVRGTLRDEARRSYGIRD